jgi:hypothetical protein
MPKVAFEMGAVEEQADLEDLPELVLKRLSAGF